MSVPELPLLEAPSTFCDFIDKTALIEGGTLTESEFPRHPHGLFMLERDAMREPALGYVACLDIRETSPGATSQRANIGKLYVVPAFRRQGHATRLVQELTDRLFTNNPDLAECIAISNPAAESIFKRVGYSPHGSGSQARIPYRLRRSEWQALQE